MLTSLEKGSLRQVAYKAAIKMRDSFWSMKENEYQQARCEFLNLIEYADDESMCMATISEALQEQGR